MRKINPILQMNQTECGLCAAAMLMEYYGVCITIHDLSTRFTVGRDGASIKVLRDIFSTYQFKSYVFSSKNNLSQIEDGLVPFIAFKKQGHFVVIESIGDDTVTILDPGIGRVEIEKEELDTEYLNILIKIEPDRDFEKVNTRGGEFRIIWDALRFNIKSLLNVLIITSLVYAITLALPILIKSMVDIFLSKHSLNNNIKILAISIVFSGFIYIFVNGLKLRASVNLSIVIDKFLSVTVINKLLKNKFEYFINRTSSDIQYRLALLKSLKTIMSDVAIQTVLDLGTMLIIFIYILNINIFYAIFLLFFSVFIIVFSFLIKDRMLMLKNKELSADNNLQILQYDIFRSIFDVKVLALTNEKHKLWEQNYEKYLDSHKKSQLFLSNYHNLLSFITLYVPIFIPLIGILLSELNRTNEISSIISLQSMGGIYINGLISISQLSDNITTMKSYISRIQDILLQEDEEHRDGEINFKGNITIKKLSFKYPGARENTLDDISFSISEGESVAIVGESGSGKSTLFYVLLGVYDNYQGIIEYEGMDLKCLNKDKLRKQIGVVPQNPLLFSGSIKENLTSDKYLDDKIIYDVLKKVSMFEFVNSLPMKLNTIISENGFNLSGGQKQRLALARAIISHKNVLILDEATSSLDNITEHSIIRYLEQDSKTKIVIAHRLNTIRNSDKIIVLKNGKICEIGNHDELISNRNEYYRMYSEEI